MSEAAQNTSLLDELLIGDPISQRQGVKCCPAIRESTDERYIVKILSIPASQVQLDALLLTGAYATPAHAMEYFHRLAKDTLEEVATLKKLHEMEGFLPYTHAEIRKGPDGTSYQVFLVSPYKRSLERQMQLEPLTHLGAVNLGLDLCAALAICRRAGYLYIDLKPSNVFITPNQGYRISDLGFISLKSLKYASYPEQYRSPYTAPEIADAMSSLNSRIDIYALGLILYQVYNNGEIPQTIGGTLPPPTYADYEMAAIIMKACDPNPANRWSDPLKMGQAIVSYMQRNSVNDTPIIPPPEPIEEEPEPEAISDDTEDIDTASDEDAVIPLHAAQDTAAEDETDEVDTILPETAPVSDEAPASSDPVLDLSFIQDPADDDTVPTEESAADIQPELVSDEVQEILDRADELISHDLPEPAVAPEPIDVPFPAPIILPEEPTAESEEPKTVAAGDSPENAGNADDADFNNTLDDSDEGSDLEEVTPDDDCEDENDDYPDGMYYDDDDDDDDNERSRRRSRRRPWLIVGICVTFVAALIAGMFLFYQYSYLQPVDQFTITGSVDSLTVEIRSSIKDELLTVVCTDTYGNTRIQEVINGRVHFTNLSPNTQYRVALNISGFHRLEGISSGSYTTAAQTEILNFNAVAGPKDGSAILSFTVNGPEAESWTVAYATGNNPESTQVFTGHSVTVTDLIVGNEYLFRLIPNEDQYLTGTWQLRYTAQQIVYAQELSIRSFSEGTLIAAWNVPDGSAAQEWNVRCYNDNGYDETITTTDSQAKFTDLDHNFGYTVEVTAVGMTQSSSATVTANPITLTDVTATPKEGDLLVLNWTFSGEPPAEGWILDYTVDGGSVVTVSCPGNTAEITKYPGSTYEFDIRPVGDITCFGKHLSYEVAQPDKFSNYNVSAKDMSFYMCRTPDKSNWDRFDVPAEDYVTSFKVGEKASFLVELWKNYKKSNDAITVTYVIRTEDGIPVSLNSVDSTWNKLWSKKFCELDIPQMPDTAGKYTVEIYFNGQRITKEAFTII